MKKLTILFLALSLSSLAYADPVLFGFEGTVSSGSQLMLKGLNLFDIASPLPIAPKFEISTCKFYSQCKQTGQQLDFVQPDGAIVTLDLTGFEDGQIVYGWWTDNFGTTSALPFELTVGGFGFIAKMELLPEPSAEQKFLKEKKSIQSGGQIDFSGVSFQ